MRKIIVSFILWYLRFFAKVQLFKIRPTVIGVGGASGKTSLGGLIRLILIEKYEVLETAGKNSETGIPLSILHLKIQDYTYFEWLKIVLSAPLKVFFDWEKYEILVAEMGIDGPDEPKNMSYLLKIIKPKIGLLTNISFEHSVYFEKISKDKEKILELTKDQEQLLLKSLPGDGLAILNLDDENIRETTGIKASKFTVSSVKRDSDFFIENIGIAIESFTVNFFSKSKEYQIKIPRLLPSHYAYSLVMAIAVGQALGIKIEDSIKALEKNFILPPGRMSVFEGIKETTIIDSSYNNATLAPIIDLLDLLNRIAGKRRKVVIIGDMRELGVVSKSYHEKVARKLLDITDLVFLIGPLSAEFIAPILSKHKHNFYSFNTFSEAKKAIKDEIKKGDIILVKSSQNTLFLERVVEMILKNQSDVQKLARRGKFWDKIRKETR